jgi:RHH-type proline utilization regulon transcriptional repressor/proline dehydrogenase/delta 1-pyrroline-5-carboxylate dehydrogenase
VVSALKPLFLKARDSGVFLNLDLERFAHRDLTYAAFADLCRDEDLRDYPHLGIVVQAYLRDSAEIVQGLIHLAKDRGAPFTVRLVKGAYWDYETILAAQEHWPSPVFLRKAETDAQFERLTKKLVDNWEWTRPALGTHNIRSIAVGVAAAEAAGLPAGALEIQVLHGMADSIRRAAVRQGYRVREYVPVGELIPGMAYLVRRLLENTANESFLRLTFAQHQDAELLLEPPAAKLAAAAVPPGEAAEMVTPAEAAEPAATAAARAPQPDVTAEPVEETCRPFRNEPHADFSREESRAAMEKALATISVSLGRDYSLLIDGAPVQTGRWFTSVNPARPSEVIGRVAAASQAEADQALESARAAFLLWRDTPAAERADILFKAAAGMRSQRFELAALEVVEAGKPWREADGDVTEAIDFLEYYGREILRLSAVWQLSDVPGESDLYFYEPRGVAAVIAPWNFPLAIPTGMVSAALAAGNSVVFKPASPTPVLGYALIRILHEAGVPGGVVAFLPGSGSEIGDYLAADPRVDLIAFTGSLDTGLSITVKAATVTPGQRSIKRVVTELGGKNAIIIDSDADIDAAVEGVLTSAFNYAGQKCSACSRVIVLDTVHDPVLRRLAQAALSLRTGDPGDPGVRVGPVISADARDKILHYIDTGRQEVTLLVPVPEATPSDKAGEVAAPDDEPSAAGDRRGEGAEAVTPTVKLVRSRAGRSRRQEPRR